MKYKGINYELGNRYHNQVELWLDGKFQFVVKMCKNGTGRKL